MTEFVIYMGTQDIVTVSHPKLSKVYRMEKGKPTAIANSADRHHLLTWSEIVKTSCCGGRKKSYPIWPDTIYCQKQGIDLYQYRTNAEEKES